MVEKIKNKPVEDSVLSENHNNDAIKRLAIMPVKELVVFPNCIMPLYVGRPRSLAALDETLNKEKLIFLATQQNPAVENPVESDLYDVGTVVEIVQSANTSDGNSKLLVEGKYVGKLLKMTKRTGYFAGNILPYPYVKSKSKHIDTLTKVVISQFTKYFQLSGRISEDIFYNIKSLTDSEHLANTISTYIPFSIEDKIKLLRCGSLEEKLNLLSRMLTAENEIQEVENKILDKVKSQIGKTQKEYFLNEQLKAIEKELGITEDEMDIKELEDLLVKSKMSKEAYEKAEQELFRLARMPQVSPEATVSRTYIEWLVELPWKKLTKDNDDISYAQKILDEDHFGLNKIKERILEYLAVLKHVKKIKGPILCFVGPPGVGKTSLGRSIARALGRKFVRISLGGVRDEAEIRGHRRTYVGALPGKIIQSMKKAGSVNPIFLLDEVDKMSVDFRGDPSSALLEVLDPEQNKSFNDHYLDVDFDLSKVMFITTANNLDDIPYPLLDRMEVLRLPGYSHEEKRSIAEKFLIPKQMKLHGLNKRLIEFETVAVNYLIDGYTQEAGVRNLEREVANLCRKTVREMDKNGKRKKLVITPDKIREMLGPAHFKDLEASKGVEVGVATGLAWTEVGGEILPAEAIVMNGKGELMLTGKLGEVMQESAKAALSYIRSKTKEFNIKPDFYQKKDIHVHVPEGAVPKDGPSAGITLATAMISALSGIPVYQDVAMTGEITLRGKVLKIGGLKEKALAAHRAHIKTVIIPKENVDDLEEMPQEVKDELKFVLVEKLEEVLEVALVKGDFPKIKEETVKKTTKKK